MMDKQLIKKTFLLFVLIVTTAACGGGGGGGGGGEGGDSNIDIDINPPRIINVVAHAGREIFTRTGSRTFLDGRISSGILQQGGEDRDILITYDWAFTEIPAGSQVVLDNPSRVNPSFIPDVDGVYVIRLRLGFVGELDEGDEINSVPAEVRVFASSDNSQPNVNAGIDLKVNIGVLAVLNGTDSFDADSEEILFQWTIIQKPEDSTASLDDSNSPKPTIVIDHAGDYTIELVTSDGQKESSPDFVTIVAAEGNSRPVADAGPDQYSRVNSLITLNGEESLDFDNQGLVYHWHLVSKPQDSNADLSDTSAARPTFMPDREGSYVIALTVNDGIEDSVVDQVIVVVSSGNNPPEANPGFAQEVVPGTQVVLNGLSSYDGDGDDLAYAWTIISKPGDSEIELSDANTATPTFIADAVGDYVIELVVSDDQSTSESKTVVISVIDTVVPVISLKGSEVVTLFVGSVYEDAGATAVDNIDGDLTDSITIENEVDVNIVGSYKVRYTVVDMAGNSATIARVVTILAPPADTTPPISSADIPGGSYDQVLEIKLLCVDDESGCAAIYYTDDGSTPTTSSMLYTSPIAVATDKTLKFFAVDNSGNQETEVRTVSYEINVDDQPPVSASSLPSGTYYEEQTISLTCDDADSGCAEIYYSLDSSQPSERYSSPIAIGSSVELKYYAVDNEGNVEAVNTRSYQIYIINNESVDEFINAGAVETGSTTLLLDIAANSNTEITGYFVKEYLIGEAVVAPSHDDGNWVGVTPSNSYRSVVSYDLQQTYEFDDVVNVAVWFKDVNIVSESATDSIIYIDTSVDLIAPENMTGDRYLSGLDINAREVNAALDASDNVGVVGYLIVDTVFNEQEQQCDLLEPPAVDDASWVEVTSSTAYAQVVEHRLNNVYLEASEVCAHVWFKDAAGNISAPKVSRYRQHIFVEDWESGWDLWSADNGIWQVGEAEIGCYEGSQCAATNLSGNYDANTDSRLISPRIQLESVTANEELHLRFQNTFSYSSYDAGYVQISLWDDVESVWSDWQIVGQSIADFSSWSLKDVDLTAYAGRLVRIAFYHTARRPAGTGTNESLGWYIDAIEIVKKAPAFSGSFEEGWADWGAERGVWQVGEADIGCYEGSQCAGTSLSGNYGAYTDSRLVSATLELDSVNGAEELHLRFQNSFSYSSYDAGYVQISLWDELDGVWSEWETVGQSIADFSSWSLKDVDLTAYAGETVRIAFYHTANRPAGTGVNESLGWYIDAIEIVKKAPAFSGSFEEGWADWGAERGVWQVGEADIGCYEGSQCAGTSLSGNYGAYTDSRLVSARLELDSVNGAEELHLRFQNSFSYSSYDAGYVQISLWDELDSVWSEWETVGQPIVDYSGWSLKDVDLTAYAGETVRIAFYHTANRPAGTGVNESLGWYIDAIEIVKKAPAFSGSFEDGWSDWGTDRGVWQVGEADIGCYEGTQCAGTNLSGNYGAYTDSRLVSATVELDDVSGPEEIHLRFQHYFSFSSYDFGYVQVSEWDAVSGVWQEWVTMGDAVSGSSTWSLKDVDLTSYAGKTVRIAFYHTANRPAGTGVNESLGWYIDSINIVKF